MEENKKTMGPNMNTSPERGGDDGSRKRTGRSKNFARRRAMRDKPKSEFERRVISTRRVARVVAGGRRFSLSVAICIGDKKGRVGIGTGNGPDMAIAMEKAYNKANKNLVKIPLTETKTIPFDVAAKFCSSEVALRPAKSFVVGGAVRTVVELAGIEHVNGKLLSRSKSHLNNARATIDALSKLNS